MRYSEIFHSCYLMLYYTCAVTVEYRINYLSHSFHMRPCETFHSPSACNFFCISHTYLCNKYIIYLCKMHTLLLKIWLLYFFGHSTSLKVVTFNILVYTSLDDFLFSEWLYASES